MRAKLLFLLIFLGLNTRAAYSYYAGNELINVPSAVMKDAGYVEYGFRSGYFVNTYMFEGEKVKIPTLDNYGFLRFSVSSRVEYGLSVYGNFQLSHHVQTLLFKAGSSDGNVTTYLSGGLKHMGLDRSQIFVSNPLYQWYGVTSVEVKSVRSRYHIGMGGDQSGTQNALVFFVGLETDFSFGTMMLEWDGYSTNLGIKVPFGKKLKENVYLSGSPHPAVRSGLDQEYGSLGFSFSQNIYDTIAEKWLVRQEYASRNAQHEQRLALLESKQNAISDVLSRDFEAAVATVSSNSYAQDASLKGPSLTRATLKLMQEGIDAYYKKDFKTALSAYQKVVGLMPDSALGYVRLGSIHYQLGNYTETLKSWEKSLSLDPNQPQLAKACEDLKDKLFPAPRGPLSRSMP